LPKADRDPVDASELGTVEQRDIEGNRFVLVVIAPISCVHKLTDAAVNVGFFEPPLVDGKRHVADHVVSVVAREVPRDGGVDAVQEAADWETQGGSQRRQFQSLDQRHDRRQRTARRRCFAVGAGLRSFERNTPRPGTINTKNSCSKRNRFLMMVYQEKIAPLGSLLPVLASEPPVVLLSQRTWPWMVVWFAAVAVIIGLVGAPLIR